MTQKKQLTKTLESIGIGRNSADYYYTEDSYRVIIWQRAGEGFAFPANVEFTFGPDDQFVGVEIMEGELKEEVKETQGRDETVDQLGAAEL